MKRILGCLIDGTYRNRRARMFTLEEYRTLYVRTMPTGIDSKGIRNRPQLQLRLRRMETHKLKSRTIWCLFLETSVSVAEANPILESKILR
jgi:tRNA uridine 5-carboxymethylaminomethyl modification enzyme